MTRVRVEPGTEEGAFPKRLTAYLIDFVSLGVVLVLVWVVAFVVAFLLFGPGGGAEGMVSAQGAVLGVQFGLLIGAGLFVFGYFTYLDGASRGTLGKRVMDVAVARRDGSPATMKNTAIRTAVLMMPYPVMALFGMLLGPMGFLFSIFVLGPWLVIEAAVMVISDDYRRLGDHAAGTVVLERATATDGVERTTATESTEGMGETTSVHGHRSTSRVGHHEGERVEARSRDDGGRGTDAGGHDAGGFAGGFGGDGGGGGE